MKFPLFPVLTVFLCIQQLCLAQQDVSQSGVSMNPLNDVYWITGPQKVSLGDFVDINIPDGYRLTDVHGARMILASINDPIPDDLVGILAPAAGKWMAILEYSHDGYVKNPAMLKKDATAVLKQVRDQMNELEASSVKSLVWQLEPAYDAQRHLLEWSLLVSTPSTKILSRTSALLGRHGVLQITVVQPLSSTDVPSLNQLASNITFKNGERYSDYTGGDKIAEIGLAELILGEKHTRAASVSSGKSAVVAGWIYCGLAVCLITGGAIAIRRRNRIPRRRRHRRAWFPRLLPSIKNKAPVNSVPSNQIPLALKINESNRHSGAKPVVSHADWWKPFNRKRRKRSFNHSKFYMEVMRNLSYSCVQTGTANGKSNSNGHTGSHINGGTNAHADVHSNGHAAANGANAKQTAKSEIEDLIAAQKSLIEQQKCIMEQQSRLIEEKRRLIEDQTALFKTESDRVIDQQPYPLKFGQ